MPAETHVWYWRKYQPDRKGEPCRIVCAGRGSVLVRFRDGHEVVAPRWAVRRRDGGGGRTRRDG